MAARALGSKTKSLLRLDVPAHGYCFLTRSHTALPTQVGRNRSLSVPVSSALQNGIGEAKALEEAKAHALRLLSLRSHSRKELVTKLTERGHSPDAITAALDRLEDVGLQNDKEFAEAYVRSKWRQSKWGPSRLKLELARRGIPNEHSNAALHAVFGEDGLRMRRYIDEQEVEESSGGWSPPPSPEAALLQAARARYRLTDGLPKEARRRFDELAATAWPFLGRSLSSHGIARK